MAQVRVTTVNLMRCWKCSAVHGQVVSLSCGHTFCTGCLEGQHTKFSEGCKQPCQACFKLTVPKKSEVRNLTLNIDLPNISGIDLNKATGGQLALISGESGDRLRPCKIGWEGTQMSEDRLREKAVLTAIEAVQNSDDYSQRAKYVKEKFDALEEGEWCCNVKHQNDKSKTSMTYYGGNDIFLRVGECYFQIWKSKP